MSLSQGQQWSNNEFRNLVCHVCGERYLEFVVDDDYHDERRLICYRCLIKRHPVRGRLEKWFNESKFGRQGLP